MVGKLDRIARSISRLTKLIEDTERKGGNYKSIQVTFIDTTSPR
ncbi:hypothetical protein [Flagellimonas taeanensis]